MAIEATTQAVQFAFPSGDSRPIAVLAAEPAVLAERHGVSFAEDEDDLDRFRYAVVDIGAAGTVWLLKHEGDPNPGTVVRADAAIDPVIARQELTATLGLRLGDVLWWATGT